MRCHDNMVGILLPYFFAFHSFLFYILHTFSLHEEIFLGGICFQEISFSYIYLLTEFKNKMMSFDSS